MNENTDDVLKKILEEEKQKERELEKIKNERKKLEKKQVRKIIEEINENIKEHEKAIQNLKKELEKKIELLIEANKEIAGTLKEGDVFTFYSGKNNKVKKATFTKAGNKNIACIMEVAGKQKSVKVKYEKFIEKV